MLQRLFARLFHSGSCSQAGSKSATIKNLLDNSATYHDLKDNSPDNDWSTLPYPDGSVIRNEEYSQSERPKTDPRDTSIILFPGQGSHHVGMCKNLMKFPGARDIFALANDVLKLELTTLDVGNVDFTNV